ncbi:Os05g0380000 [Oryza sativa Japonica Group]|uniref:Os05g0380000 protein n=1 Tax=Oryza sativa subsp. japonica TaxID=39947 RepID=A0A0P0WLX9_ORYSJ|nr:Os05g0380000 [Oryza sativa Japonica Group]
MVLSTRTVRDLHDGTQRRLPLEGGHGGGRGTGMGKRGVAMKGPRWGGAGCGGDADGDDLLPSGVGGCGSEAASMADWL